MSVDEAIELLETFVESDIRDLLPKDRLIFWSTLKEFQRPKMQRSTFEPLVDKESEIKISYPK